jgi:undecaprenyl diphosphate synthase
MSDDAPQTPQHVAIIMDGNGRWARARNLPRTAGHQKGIEAVRRATESAIELGIPYLTLFGFSSENWSRPHDEVSELMRLLRYYLRAETAELHKSGISLRVIGDRSRFDHDIVDMIENAERLTADNTRLKLTIALNYGGRQDILQAVQQVTDHAWRQNKHLTAHEIEQLFPQFLYTSGLPDPDLMIRTSGEQRISNFLIWSCAYTEFYFTDVLWPDFSKSDLQQALEVYAQRERRFGAVKKTTEPYSL